MKSWTRRVVCKEFAEGGYNWDYSVFATLCEDGTYRLAERRFYTDRGGMFPYGLVLTEVRVKETRKQYEKRRRAE